jgi:hypothetical protein
MQSSSSFFARRWEPIPAATSPTSARVHSRSSLARARTHSWQAIGHGDAGGSHWPRLLLSRSGRVLLSAVWWLRAPIYPAGGLHGRTPTGAAVRLHQALQAQSLTEGHITAKSDAIRQNPAAGLRSTSRARHLRRRRPACGLIRHSIRGGTKGAGLVFDGEPTLELPALAGENNLAVVAARQNQ